MSGYRARRARWFPSSLRHESALILELSARSRGLLFDPRAPLARLELGGDGVQADAAGGEQDQPVVDQVGVPVIASGGAGSTNDLIEAVQRGGADAVLAASIFHFGEIGIGEAKSAMAAAGLPMRLT